MFNVSSVINNKLCILPPSISSPCKLHFFIKLPQEIDVLQIHTNRWVACERFVWLYQFLLIYGICVYLRIFRCLFLSLEKKAHKSRVQSVVQNLYQKRCSLWISSHVQQLQIWEDPKQDEKTNLIMWSRRFIWTCLFMRGTETEFNRWRKPKRE